MKKDDIVFYNKIKKLSENKFIVEFRKLIKDLSISEDPFAQSNIFETHLNNSINFYRTYLLRDICDFSFDGIKFTYTIPQLLIINSHFKFHIESELEARIYSQLYDELSGNLNKETIESDFFKKFIKGIISIIVNKSYILYYDIPSPKQDFTTLLYYLIDATRAELNEFTLHSNYNNMLSPIRLLNNTSFHHLIQNFGTNLHSIE